MGWVNGKRRPGGLGRTRRLGLAMALVCGLGASLAWRGASPAWGAGGPVAPPLEVVVSIQPLGDMVRQVGGERVKVTVLVPPGSNPHVYALKPAQMAALSRARLLVLNGLGLELWGGHLADAAQPGLKVVRLAEGLPGGPVGHAGESGHGEAAHGHAAELDWRVNPHVWLDPVLAMEMAKKIERALILADPAQTGGYQAGGRAYQSRLAALAQRYQTVLAPAKGKTFVAFHPSYVHLARRYGLKQLVLVEGGGGQEATPARMAGVIAQVRRLNIGVVFAEPQFAAKSMEVLAHESGARLALLDPLGKPGQGYVEIMEQNLAQLQKAFFPAAP